METVNDWVLVESDYDQFNAWTEKNGIISVEEKPDMIIGTVLSAGRGIKMKKGVSLPELKVGEKVIFEREKRNLTGNERTFLVRERDILGVLDEEE